jgi:hypothetical protein
MPFSAFVDKQQLFNPNRRRLKIGELWSIAFWKGGQLPECAGSVQRGGHLSGEDARARSGALSRII